MEKVLKILINLVNIIKILNDNKVVRIFILRYLINKSCLSWFAIHVIIIIARLIILVHCRGRLRSIGVIGGLGIRIILT